MPELSREESAAARLKALVTERHAAFAQEMWALLSGIVAPLEEEVRALRAENDRHQRFLEATQEKKERRKAKPRRKVRKKPDSPPDETIEILTENSSDSEHEQKNNSPPKEEEQECAVTPDQQLEPETENSSDSEDEQEPVQTETPPNNAPQPDSNDVVVLSDPQTENSSEAESECDENAQTSGKNPAKRKKTEGKKQVFVCAICSKSFNYRSVMKMHMLSHANSRPFECSECGSSFVMKYHLDRHMEIHIRNRPSSFQEGTQPQRSSDPDVETESPTVVEVSDMEDMAELQPAPVDEMGDVEEEVGDLEDEMGDLEEEHSSKTPQCLQCGKTFSNTGNLRKHLRNLHCKKATSITKQLQMQVKWRHQHLACTVCEKRFRFQSELKRHMKSTHMKSANTKSSHKKSTHTKTARTKTAQTKTAHTKTAHTKSTDTNTAHTTTAHTKTEKGFPCDFCQKRFRDKTYLQEHVRVHTGEKPYRCLICGKCFTFRKSHNAHMKIHEKLPSPDDTADTY